MSEWQPVETIKNNYIHSALRCGKSYALYFCNFKPGQREIELRAKLLQYYKNTPNNMPNKVASRYWKQFIDWCRINGFTQDEITAAKKSIAPYEYENIKEPE